MASLNVNGANSITPTEFRYLEDFALNPELRHDLVKACTPYSKEHYLSQLKLLSQELQEASVNPSADDKASDTVKKIERALKLLHEAESSLYLNESEKKQLKAQFAILGYSVNPKLLLKELAFNPDTITLLNTSAPSTSPPIDGEQEGDICDSLPSVMDESVFDIESICQQFMDKLLKKKKVRIPKLAWPHLLAQPQMRSILLEKLTPTELLWQFQEMNLECSSKSIGLLEDTSNIDDSTSWDAFNRGSDIEELIVDVILKLYWEKKLDFSEHGKYNKLTSTQLELIKEKEPGIVNNEGFVGLLEKRILPRVFDNSPKGTGNVKDPKTTVHGEWLTRMIEFVDALPSKFNRHKLAVYLMSLEYNLTKGVIDRDRFMKFIKIPRNHSHYNPSTLKKIYEPSFIVDTINSQTLPYWSDRVKPVTSARDEEIVREYLSHFLALEKSGAAFESYFDLASYLNPMLARVMLYSGDQDIQKWSSMLATSDGGIVKFTEKTIIKFAYDNPEIFLPSDPVVFKLKVKNTKRILVRVFEIKTLEYLQQYGDASAFGLAMNLDGLTPNWEKHLTLDYPPLEMHDLLIDLPELANHRGAFVMDVISNGENSSAYFTKGYLDFVERQSVAGHVLTIIDEDKRKIDKDVRVLFNGNYYKPNAYGDIVIPYNNRTTTSDKNIYITHNDFTTLRPFYHRVESYEMNMLCYIDHESLVAGSVAKILIKANVMISNADVICPVGLLEQVVLEVETTDASDIEGTITIPDFKLDDVDWTEYSFQVPENLAHVTFKLSAKIKVLSTGKFEDLYSSKELPIDGAKCDEVVVVHVGSRKQDVLLQGEVIPILRASTPSDSDTIYEIVVTGKN
ncbi:hypothetical protein BGZ46_003696, partial [Entomortierella lignicola]